MVRAPCFDKNGVKRGAWSEEEDNMLTAYIEKCGHSNWRELPKLAGLSRCGKSCRLRWLNYLRPNIKHGNFTKQEEHVILEMHNKHGNKWSMMSARLPGRSDNEIKNHWHAHLKNRSQRDHNNTTTTVKNEELRSLEPANSKGCLVKNPNFETKQEEVELLIAVLSSESRSSCSTSESSPACSLSVTDYPVSNDIMEPTAFTNLSHELFIAADNNDGVVSSSYNMMFSPYLSLDHGLISSQQASFPDYIMEDFDDVLLW